MYILYNAFCFIMVKQKQSQFNHFQQAPATVVVIFKVGLDKLEKVVIWLASLYQEMCVFWNLDEHLVYGLKNVYNVHIVQWCLIFYNKCKLTNSLAYGTQRAQCHIQKGSLIIPIMSQIGPIPEISQLFGPIPEISQRSILILSSYLCIGLPIDFFPCRFTCLNLKSFSTFLYSGSLPCIHLNFLDLLNLMKLSDAHTLFISFDALFDAMW